MRSGIASAPRTSASSSRPPSALLARTASAARASSARQRGRRLAASGPARGGLLVNEPPAGTQRRDELVGRLEPGLGGENVDDRASAVGTLSDSA